MGDGWVTESGNAGTITVTRRNDAWYLTEPPRDGDVQCIVTGGSEPAPTDSPSELKGTVSKYVRSTDDSPDSLFFEPGSSGTETTERGKDYSAPTDMASSVTDPTPGYPKRRLTDLSGSGEYVTVEAVVDSIEWVRKDEPNVPDIVGELRDERSEDVLPFAVSDGVRHPYLEEGTVFEFTGGRDHHYEKRDQIQVLITDRTAFDELGTTTSKMSRKSGGSKNSANSKRSELDSIADSMIGERVFTEHEQDRDSTVGNAKRRARRQGRDPAIDPKFR